MKDSPTETLESECKAMNMAGGGDTWSDLIFFLND